MGRIELEFHKIVFSFSLTLYFHRLIKRCSLKLVQSSAVSFPTLKKPTTIARCLRRCFQTAATSYHTTGCPSGVTPPTLLLALSTIMYNEIKLYRPIIV